MAKTTTHLPTFAQVIALLITKAEHDLSRLPHIRDEDDEHWNDEDIGAELAAALVLDKVRSLKAKAFAGSMEFGTDWHKCTYTLELALNAFSRKDCHYYRTLNGLHALFDQGVELVEFAELHNKKPGQRAA
jgi:hypothetical protein